MKAYLIRGTQSKAVEIENHFEVFLDIIGCRCFDIASRKVGGKYYDIFCDDEGLFVEHPVVTGGRRTADGGIEPMLVGNLVFTLTDGEGGTIGITDEDVNNIEENMIYYWDGEVIRPIVLMEY